MGRIPVFVYSDLPWVPYQGSLNSSIEQYGYLAAASEIPQLVDR
jgi:hypothetical protein